jgi:lysophospholipase L1-like esterase
MAVALSVWEQEAMKKTIAAAAFLLLGALAAAQPAPWVASWSSAQQAPEPENALAPELLQDATLRQVVRLSIGGSSLRLRLSNVFGTVPLHLLGVHVARPAGAGEIDPAGERALTFSGRPEVIIPAGASYLSDPVDLPVAALSDLAISIHYGEPPAGQTSHPGSRTTSYVAPGDQMSAAQLTGAKTVDHWYQIASVEVMAKASALVVLGDSITDGRGSTTNANNRWTDILAQQLKTYPRTRMLAVLNAGLGGNRLLNDIKGPNTLARFDRDVLAQPGVAGVIVLEGINDLGTLTVAGPVPAEMHDALVKRMIGAYEQIAARAHAHGLKAYISTIMPFMGTEFYHPDAANEADRNAVNAWIRGQTLFDGVLDFDRLMADPAQPDHLNPAYDTGDFLHPSPAGYVVMGKAAAAFLAHAENPAAKPHHRKNHKRK